MGDSILIVDSPAEGAMWQRHIAAGGYLGDAVLTDDLSRAQSVCAEGGFRAVLVGAGLPAPDIGAFLTWLGDRGTDPLVLLCREPELFQQPLRFRGQPCPTLPPRQEAEALESSLRSALLLHDWQRNRRLAELTAKMTRFPSVPSLYVEICNKLQSPDASLEDVAVHIAHDLAMSATLLRIVNSTAFALARQIKTAFEAVLFLGTAQTKSLILFSQLFSQFVPARCKAFSLDEFWLHSVGVANMARWIAREESGDTALGDEAYTAGLLHDTGRLLLATNQPDLVTQLASLPVPDGVPPWRVEQERMGATHAELGALLLARWGLPYPILEAIGFHHQPMSAPGQGAVTLTAVHAANVLDYEKRFGKASRERFDEECLQTLYPESPAHRWRELVGVAPPE